MEFVNLVKLEYFETLLPVLIMTTFEALLQLLHSICVFEVLLFRSLIYKLLN